MVYKNNILSLDRSGTSRGGGKRFMRSLEYEVLASLTLQNFQKESGEVDYEKLLSIPAENRIPGLLTEYGKKRMHKLIKMILSEFCYAVPLPKSQKLTDTKISVCSCDLMIAAFEDHMSLEDLILFFERAKQGKYGPFKKLLTHHSIMEKLELYRQQRYDVYMRIKEAKEAELKNSGTTPQRISPEPTAIKNLFDDPNVGLQPLKKIS
jgi:hypothetical protein